MHKGVNNSGMINEAPTWGVPVIKGWVDSMSKTVLNHLIGKKFKLTSMDGKSSIDVQIESVDDHYPALVDNNPFDEGGPYGHFDVNLINQSGGSTGGFLGTGTFNNLDLYWNCWRRGFYVDKEYIGRKNRATSEKNWFNDQLQTEINNKFCRVMEKKIGRKMRDWGE